MREGLQAKRWGLKECGGFSAHLFLVCWMLCQGAGLPLLEDVRVPACAARVHATHSSAHGACPSLYIPHSPDVPGQASPPEGGDLSAQLCKVPAGLI